MYSLIGLPLSCLLLKVCNYDAGCIYFGIAGISLLVLADKRKDLRLAFIAVIVSLLSCLEKWAGLPYWCICVAGLGVLTRKYKNNSWLAILYELESILISVFICLLSLVYIRLIEEQGLVDMSVGVVLFPIYFMFSMFIKYDGIHYDDFAYYDNMVFEFLPVVVIAIIVFSFLLTVGWKAWNRVCNSKWFIPLSAGFVLTFFFISIISCFTVIRGVYPFTEIPEGYYVPGESMNGTTYFYNASTRWGYLLCVAFYSFSVVLTNLPSVILAAAIIACVLAFGRSGRVRNDEEYIIYLIGVLTVFLPVGYSLAGDPAVPRYFGVSVTFIPLLSIYTIYRYMSDFEKIKAAEPAMYLLFIAEMLIYIPNYTTFAPVWLYRSPEWKQSVRQGEWATAEAMMWGEDLAIAGTKIEDMLGSDTDYERYTIYGNYGSVWLQNPGFIIKSMLNDADTLSFTEYDYYVFTKFKVYRSPEPDFLYEIEPDATIKYNGEIAAWIYRGDRIADRTSYFE